MMTLASRFMCKYRSKVSRPYKHGEFDLLFGEGTCKVVNITICCTRKFADELLLRSSKNGTAFVTAVLMKGCLVKKSWCYKSQMILCSGIGNENAKEFASSKIACINLHGKRHGLYKQISNMCCRCTLTSVKLISIYTWEWY
ncbi:unnamed protein product [Sphagnum jensenii]|uniref:Ribosomal protein S11 n=1 Tax=Sphagnum jensenii TaxID=128206 RepID=A0ABP1A9M4_9BRYO